MLVAAVLRGVLLPAAVAAVVLALAWAGRRRGAREWAAALAVAVGYAAGHMAVAGRPPWPPIEATQRLAYIGLGTGALAALPSWWRRVAVALALPVLLLWPLVRNSWSTTELVVRLGGTGAGILVLASAMESLGGRPTGHRVPLVLAAAAGAGSAAILVAGSALVAQLAGVLAAALGALVVAAALWPERSPSGAILPGFGLHCGLLLVGHHYVEMPALTAVGLAIAPAIAALLLVRPHSSISESRKSERPPSETAKP